MYEVYSKRLIALIPRFLGSEGFRKDLEADLGDKAPKIISDIAIGKQIEGDDGDLLSDAARDALFNH